MLKKRKVQFIRIDGSTPTSARGSMVTTFQEVDAVRVAILSIKAAGMGLTLTAASTVSCGGARWNSAATRGLERRATVSKFKIQKTTRIQKVAVFQRVWPIREIKLGALYTAVVFGELSWTPGDIVQAEDRAHRIGQVSSVNVQFLCARNTVDDIMWGSVQNKLESLGQVLDGGGAVGRSSTYCSHTRTYSLPFTHVFLRV